MRLGTLLMARFQAPAKGKTLLPRGLASTKEAVPPNTRP